MVGIHWNIGQPRNELGIFAHRLSKNRLIRHIMSAHEIPKSLATHRPSASDHWAVVFWLGMYFGTAVLLCGVFILFEKLLTNSMQKFREGQWRTGYNIKKKK